MVDTALTSDEASHRQPLRYWPGLVAAVAFVAVRFGVPLVLPDAAILGVLGALLIALIIIVWWLFFSRVPWSERLGVLVLIVVALLATARLVHPSIRTGMMGNMTLVYVSPFLFFALAAGVIAGRAFGAGRRRVTIVAAVLLACGVWTLLRTDGVTGTGVAQLAWRWSETPEQRLLAEGALVPETLPLDPAPVDVVVDWPGFRGARRDDVIRGVRLQTDWSASPPVELWRRPIGPGWSSFAVGGGLLYTQEQRGDDEIVAAYETSSGEPVWVYRDPVRFWESNGGAGPRATPALRDGRIYALGATGILNVLDAGTGAVVWSRDAASDTGGNLPYWGFSSSPLVLGDLVIVYAGGLAAYDRAGGAPRWVGEGRGVSYSSPHLATIDGVTQLLQMTGTGVIGVAPADGKLLWEHAWEGAPILQPALTAEGDVLIATGSAMGGLGLRRLAVAHGAGGWAAEERWTSRGLKPYFNDFVIHDGRVFGFDGSILSCIDLQDGTRLWKGGRYGNGQLVLLADQSLLLVVSEEGELALVEASPEHFTELARFPALDGKTWNHPVLVGDLLLVRNGQEIAAFRLPLEGG